MRRVVTSEMRCAKERVCNYYINEFLWRERFWQSIQEGRRKNGAKRDVIASGSGEA